MKLEDILEIKRIVFYDGDCGFCNSSIQFILKNKKRDFHFIALQSRMAEEILGQHNEEIKMNTLYFLENKKLYQKSSAALKITFHLKGFYPIIYFLGSIFPRFFRDWVYDQIAKRRNSFKPGYCVKPTEEELSYFLK